MAKGLRLEHPSAIAQMPTDLIPLSESFSSARRGAHSASGARLDAEVVVGGATGLLSLLVLGLGDHTFVANLLGTEAEVDRAWTKIDSRLGNVDVCIELRILGHDLAFEGGAERPEAPEVDDVAIGYEFASHIGGEVKDALYLHIVQRGVFGDKLAEALEADLLTSRRGSLDDYLAFVFPDPYGTFGQRVP